MKDFLDMGLTDMDLLWGVLLEMAEREDMEGMEAVFRAHPEIFEEIEREAELEEIEGEIDPAEIESSWEELKERLIREGIWVEDEET